MGETSRRKTGPPPELLPVDAIQVLTHRPKSPAGDPIAVEAKKVPPENATSGGPVETLQVRVPLGRFYRWFLQTAHSTAASSQSNRRTRADARRGSIFCTGDWRRSWQNGVGRQSSALLDPSAAACVVVCSTGMSQYPLGQGPGTRPRNCCDY